MSQLSQKFKQLTTKKKVTLIVAFILTIAVLGGAIAYTAYYVPEWNQAGKFYDDIEATDIFDNSLDDAMPQTIVKDIIYKHFNSNTSGKTPKLLFVGYDGCAANMVAPYYNLEGSAMAYAAADGGLYFTYAGGAKKGDQATSTAPGWASIFTGVWGSENGVTGNADVLNENTRSIIYTLGSANISTSYTVSWDTHITTTYSKEVSSAKANNYPITYTAAEDDDGTTATVLSRINANDDAVFCILEAADHEGHATGFDTESEEYNQAVVTNEANANLMLDAVKNRATYNEEDWLIIITTDHGGCAHGHGARSVMERTTWIAVNKQI